MLLGFARNTTGATLKRSVGVFCAVLIVTAVCGAAPRTTPRGKPTSGGPEVRAVRGAIEDLVTSFGARYPKGREYLRRLDGIEKRLGTGDAKAREELVSLQREALLANPLLDFEKLLLVRRGARNLGLPRNWQSNSSLKRNGFDNQIVTLSMNRLGDKPTVLYTPSGGAFVGDVDLHFDGTRMLFSSIGANQRWQVFEMGLDGKPPRQLPLIEQPDVDNYDACYLPDGNILFTSTAPFTGVPCVRGSAHVTNLYRLEAASGTIRRLTFDQDHDWCPTVLNSGHVLYLRWEYSDIPHFVSRILFRMNPDGTGQMAHYGSNSYWPNSMFYARPIPGHPTKFVAVISGHHDTSRMGELVLFDAAKGRHEADGVVQRIPGRGKPVEPIILDGLVGKSWPKFLHPYPLNESHFLVSCQPTAQSQWGVYLVDVFDNIVLLAEEKGYALLEPVPLRPTPRPPAIPSKVDPSRNDAVVYLTDVYAGPGLAGIPRGTVKKLRLFTYHFSYQGVGGQVNRVGLDGPWDIKRVLGTVPVEADGSAMFRVPANTPISIQPLDAEGKALQLMRSWMTAMPGEVLSCVGCHEKLDDGSPNRRTLASARPASTIKPWYGPARGFSFRREVQPVLDRRCVGCHDGKKAERPNFTRRPPEHPPAEKSAYALGTKFTPSYLALRRFARPPTIESDMHMLMPMEFHADTSKLVRMLRKGHHGVTLDAEERDRILTWIDLGAPAHGTWREIAGEKNASAVGAEHIAHQRDRRREMMKLYAGRDEDPEAIAEAPQVTFIQPPPGKTSPPAKVSCASFPFDGQEAAKRQAAGPRAVSRTIDLGDGMKLELARIPAGEFIMGDESGFPDERPRAVVRIDKSFWIGRFEITNAQFRRLVPSHDSRLEHGDFLQFSVDERGYPVNGSRQPVVRVSWNAAMEFCRRLSAATGESVTLPTEAQWEYACRAGTATPMNYGAADVDFGKLANLADVSLKVDMFPRWKLPSGAVHNWRARVATVDDKHRVTAPVGSYMPNAWGLHDMHGNAAEWTLSSYRPYPYTGRNAPDATGRKVVRGGSWYDRPQRARSAQRTAYHPHQGVFDVGFRVICGAAQAPVIAKETK